MHGKSQCETNGPPRRSDVAARRSVTTIGEPHVLVAVPSQFAFLFAACVHPTTNVLPSKGVDERFAPGVSHRATGSLASYCEWVELEKDRPECGRRAIARVLWHVLRDGGLGDLDAELEQLAVDPHCRRRRTPSGRALCWRASASRSKPGAGAIRKGRPGWPMTWSSSSAAARIATCRVGRKSASLLANPPWALAMASPSHSGSRCLAPSCAAAPQRIEGKRWAGTELLGEQR